MGLIDNEIIKALEESISFDEPYESDFTLIRIEYIKNTLDLINRLQAKNLNLTSDLTSLQNDLTSLQAENERLTNSAATLTKSISELTDEVERQKKAKDESFQLAANIVEAEKIVIAATKNKAYGEFADKVCDEITDAIINNDKVIKERIEKHNVNRLEDSFCCMCDGKIRALGGIEYFIKNLLKELVGDGSGKM